MGSQKQQIIEACEKMQTRAVVIWQHVNYTYCVITKNTLCVCVCVCMWIFSVYVCVCVRVYVNIQCVCVCVCVCVCERVCNHQIQYNQTELSGWYIYTYINMNIKLTFEHMLQAQAMCLNYYHVIPWYKSLYRHCLVLFFLCQHVFFCFCSGGYLAVLLFCHTLLPQICLWNFKVGVVYFSLLMRSVRLILILYCLNLQYCTKNGYKRFNNNKCNP